jgi:Exocyst complex component Sec3
VCVRLQVSLLRKRLEAEQNALEAANVQAILGSVAAVPRVLDAMKRSSGRLTDLDLTLNVFDGKLVSMREDIASIESRNSSLDTQARNLERLQGVLLELFKLLSVRLSSLSSVVAVGATISTAGRPPVY